MSIATKKAIFSGTALVLMFIVFSILKPTVFLEKSNLINITQQVVTYSIIGFGLTFCLVCGGTDLSAGASMGLGGIIVVYLLSKQVSIPMAITLALIFGILMGILNGFSIEVLGVVPFIATLGTQWVFRGLAYVLVAGAPIYVNSVGNKQIEDAFYQLGGGRFADTVPLLGSVPYSVVITFVYGFILLFIITKTKIGRQIYACGSNHAAARLSGIDVITTRMFAYCVSGLSAVICGILVASRASSAQPTAGIGYELEAIAASVVGGVSINGGEGTILNTIIGALIMGVLRNGLNLNGVSSFWQMVIIGVIVVAACAMEAQRRKKNG